jgi:uncharacterized heparinase superfamily protein
MSVFGRRCIVNTGVSTYQRGAERNYERSTQAHNTVEINRSNSSDVWAGFRVARRAMPFDRFIERDDSTCTVKCAHSGYAQAPNNAIHEREWRFGRSVVSIIDRVRGDIRTGCAYLHFHPNCEVWEDGGAWRVAIDEKTLSIESSGGSTTLEDYDWHESFGRSERARRMVIPFEGVLTVTLNFGGRH